MSGSPDHRWRPNSFLVQGKVRVGGEQFKANLERVSSRDWANMYQSESPDLDLYQLFCLVILFAFRGSWNWVISDVFFFLSGLSVQLK